MTSSSNDTDRRALAKVISAAVGGWNAETRAITNVADAILTEFLPGHDERVKAEQREADAQIAETRYFGGGVIGAAHRWGAKQAAAAIRKAGTNA